MINTRELAQQPLQTFQWMDGEDPCNALVRALSNFLGVEPMDMEPLFDTVDPDALSNILYPPRNPRSQPSVSVQFEYHNHQIVINENGQGYIFESAMDSDTIAQKTSQVADTI